MKIGLLLISTNRYTQFLQPLITSADEYFMKNHEVTYFIFTNQNINLRTNRDVVKIDVEHKDWPWMTLGRYKFFTNNYGLLEKMDYLYYCDVDMRFEGEIGEEILSGLVATQHHGYCGGRGTPETNPASLACVFPDEPMEYFAGGFNGGTSEEFLKMSRILSHNIDLDFSRGVIAIWHDESHMNRYFINNKPTKILDPGYCFFEYNLNKDNRFYPRLVALVKKHEELR